MSSGQSIILKNFMLFSSTSTDKFQLRFYTYFEWTEDGQGFQIRYLTLDT